MSYSSYFQFPEFQYFKEVVYLRYLQVSQWLQKQRFFIIIKLYFWIIVNQIEEKWSGIEKQMRFSDVDVIQAACIMSHIITLILFVKLLFSYNNMVNYHLSCLCIVLTYFIVIYRHFLYILEHEGASIMSLVKSDNTYLLATAILMVNSSKSSMKLVPFVLYSFLNLYNWIMGEVFKNSMISKAIMEYSDVVEEKVLMCASVVELLVISVYLKDCIYNFNWLIIYASILFLRMDSSNSLNNISRQLVACIGKLTKQEIVWDSKPKRNQRITSVNFETVEVINDL